MAMKEKLIAVGAEKLADVLLSLRANNKEIRKEVDIILAGFDEKPQKLVSMINKEISALKRSTKFISYKESNDLAKRLESLRLRIANDLFLKSPKTAFELMLEFLDLHADTLERSDDSGGSIGDVFCAACKDLSKLSETANLLPSAVVKIAFNKFMNNDYSIYDKIIPNLKNALKEEGLSMLKSKFMQCHSKEQSGSFKNGTVLSGLKMVADCWGDIDEYINSCALQVQISNNDMLEIAERLIEKGRSREAISWLDRVNSKHYIRDCCRLRVQAFQSLDEHVKAQEERISWFNQDLSSGVYEEILKFSTSDAKSAFRNETMLAILSHPDPILAGCFLIEIKEKEEFSKFIRTRFCDLPSDRCYILRPAAEQLQDNDPIVATLLYRKMINAVLYRANSKYRSAAKDLVTCVKLKSKICDWEGFKTHDEYFESLKNEHKYKRNFWADYEEAQTQPSNPKRKKV